MVFNVKDFVNISELIKRDVNDSHPNNEFEWLSKITIQEYTDIRTKLEHQLTKTNYDDVLFPMGLLVKLTLKELVKIIEKEYQDTKSSMGYFNKIIKDDK